jgi:mannose-6-phosphate isomerase-like protein (cupin superfamily)
MTGDTATAPSGKTDEHVVAWRIDELITELTETMATQGEGAHSSWFENRVVGLLASQYLGNASKMAIGISGVPAGVATVEHHHESEEFAIVISGSGDITIAGRVYPVSVGSVVLAPSNAPHVTRAADSQALLILWVYSPPGSEARWIKGAAAPSPTTI